MGCSQCGRDPVFSRGLCQRDYWRARRSGEIKRVNSVNNGSCKQPGCDRQAFAKGLCSKHYQQARHPLSSIWRSLRHAAQGAYPKEWDRFEAFLADVGERPSSLHQLRRPNPNAPWSKANFHWKPPVTTDPTIRSDSAKYAWLWHIKNRYGLEPDDLARMADEQDGKCPICQRELGYLHRDTGKPTKVCIDHDHVTRVVRGLTCDDDNKAMGMLDDDADRAQRAADYLRKHQGKGER